MSSNPHDRLVKKALSNPADAAGELRSVMPAELAARIDWSALTLEPGSLVDDEGREWQTDLLFRAPLQGQPARSAFVYLLIEHQSTVDRWMPLRMLVYLGRIWTRIRERGEPRLPLVVPVVLHNGTTAWTSPRRLSELLDLDEETRALSRDFIPDLELLIDDLARISEPELLARPMSPLAKLVLWVLRAVRLGYDPRSLPRWAEQLRHAKGAAGLEALLLLFGYLTRVEGGQPLLEALLEKDVGDDAREIAMTLKDQWEAEGRAKGRAEERANVLLKLLQLKFGPLDGDTQNRVREASPEELDKWIERVLTAETLERLFA